MIKKYISPEHLGVRGCQFKQVFQPRMFFNRFCPMTYEGRCWTPFDLKMHIDHVFWMFTFLAFHSILQKCETRGSCGGSGVAQCLTPSPLKQCVKTAKRVFIRKTRRNNTLLHLCVFLFWFVTQVYCANYRTYLSHLFCVHYMHNKTLSGKDRHRLSR